MIDHTGHPHPSTPKARALCRANGGTGFIGKIGDNAPVAKKGDNDKPLVGKRPHVVDVTPKKPTVKRKAPVGKPVEKPTGPTPPKLPPPRGMSDFIPPATGKSPSAQIQNALRRGASRDFIKARVKIPPEQVDREIDRLLSNNGVPHYIYPRKGTGRPGPDIKDVKPTSKPRATPEKTVPVPPSGDSSQLSKALGNVDVDPRVKQNVDRVLKIQHSHVGDKVSRIRSVDSNLPSVNSVQGAQWGVKDGTLAVCEHSGNIHLHKNLHAKEDLVQKSIASGWFTKGGSGIDQTIAHEMGHALLTDLNMRAVDRKALAEAMIEHLGLTSPWGAQGGITYHFGMLDRIVQHPSNKVKIRRAVSKYGATNANEFIAEVWSEYTLNPKPRPKIQKLGDTIKSIIEKGF